MAVLKCKMCGGTLEVTEGMKVVECDYCGTTQTIPNDDNEKKINLFNRANRMRMANEFDKAASIYENIIAEFPDEAEAYWGLCLCKYGIEYVDDPKTATKIPTCHRTLFESIFNDADYKAALDRSDVIAQDVYKKEATEIDRLQKEILELVAKEEPYDVFICYKETDDSGKRTPDSVLGQDIYDALTNKGHKVFFARITLEDKLGRAYEPCIFAALNSAKIMLSLGTKPEYFEAVWVKNEWSRFLEMMKADRSKMLIPCYRDMDAYDLPEEFSHLQAQDMGKLGFLQDLIRGIEKILGVEQKPAQQAPAAAAAVNSAVEPLLRRANLFLEDKDYKSAQEYFDRVLDLEPECAEAYLGKLMVEYSVNKLEMLTDQYKSCSQSGNYQKAMRFADAALKEKMEKLHTGWKELVYQKACNLQQSRDYQKAIDNFREIIEYKDAKQRIAACEQGIIEKRYRKACGMMEAGSKVHCENAIEIFREIIEYKDARQKIAACEETLEFIRQKEIYQIAQGYLNTRGKISEVRQAYDLFRSIESFQDAAQKMDECSKLIKQYEEEERRQAEEKARAEKEEAERQAREKERKERNRKKLIKITSIIGSIIAVVAVVAITINLFKNHEIALENREIALELCAGDDQIAAMTALIKADGYKKVADLYRTNFNTATIAAGYHTVGLKADGTVVAVGDNRSDQCDVSDWKHIVAVAAGGIHTVGLKADGTVVAVGNNDDSRCNVYNWTDIVAVVAGSRHTVGLKSDGTVVAVGDNDDGQCEISDWTDIIAVAAGDDHTVGLKSDGTVVAVGDNWYGQCDVSDWTDIVAVAAGDLHTVGLKSDGTVVAVGSHTYGACDVSNWTDIVAVAAGDCHTVGLKSDGTVVATKILKDRIYLDHGQSNVSDWTDIQLP